MDEQRFYDEVGRRLETQAPESTREVVRLVLYGLHIQLHEEAAREVEDQLPQGLRELWRHRHEALKEERGARTRFARGQFIKWVADHSGVGDPYQAEKAIRAVFGALRAQAPGIEPIVRRELSEGIRELWAGTATQPAPGATGR